MIKKSTEAVKTNTILVGTIIFLLFLLVILLVKVTSERVTLNNFVDSTQQSTQTLMNLTDEEAVAFGSTVGTIPSNNPIYKQPQELETYVKSMSTLLDRDIVVLDLKRTILADTIPANIGKPYLEDIKNEVAETMGDGQPRRFIEKSADYPDGILEVVVPIIDQNKTIIGGGVFSSSHLHSQ